MANTNRQAVIEPLLLRADQAARLLSISRSKFYAMHSAGLVPAPIELGGSVRWNLGDLKRWIQNGCVNREQWELLKDNNIK